MLDCDAQAMPGEIEIKRLTCTVRLPPAWEDNFELHGVAPALAGCKRRFARLRCRGKQSLVALELRQTLPSLPRAQAWFAVYLTDIGRGGIGFLHGEPLYPNERFKVVLFDGRRVHVEIVRCQRIDDRCFSIGAQFVEERSPKP